MHLGVDNLGVGQAVAAAESRELRHRDLLHRHLCQLLADLLAALRVSGIQREQRGVAEVASDRDLDTLLHLAMPWVVHLGQIMSSEI